MFEQFQYLNDELYIEDVSINKISTEVGTPCYIYSYKSIKERFDGYDF